MMVTLAFNGGYGSASDGYTPEVLIFHLDLGIVASFVCNIKRI